MSDKPSTGTKADTSSGSGTNKGPSTGASASGTSSKGTNKPSTQPVQTCDCNRTGSCTCAPGQCACFNCPNPPSFKEESKAAPESTAEEWTVL